MRKYSDEFRATIKVMWNDGKLAREIADATGTTTSIIASFIQYHRSEFPRHSPGKPKAADWHKPEIVATIRKLIAAGANYKMIKAAVLKQHGVSMSTGRLSGALGTLRLRLEPLAHIRAAWRQPDIISDIQDMVILHRSYKFIIDHVSHTYGVTLSSGMIRGAVCDLGLRRGTRRRKRVAVVTRPMAAPVSGSTIPPLRSELLRQQGTQHD